MNARIFPGQGAQFSGMGKDLFDQSPEAASIFEKANDILGFRITDTMFTGSDDELRRTDVTQPAIFIHSVIVSQIQGSHLKPDMVAGHSLGEFSSLVASGCISFEDALKLVATRASAMQKACEQIPGTMAAILGLDDAIVEEVCAAIKDEIVVPANYNCPGQLVISGSVRGIELACEAMKIAGAKRALPLQVGGAFHSPLMEPAREELAMAINSTQFNTPRCPVYQNVSALGETSANRIKENLIAQLTAPVRWTQSVRQMHEDGANEFIECGPGKVLQGLVKKILSDVTASSY
ncbi:MAG: ACP S-malonyltransferase [Bacteroidia bacterium]